MGIKRGSVPEDVYLAWHVLCAVRDETWRLPALKINKVTLTLFFIALGTCWHAQAAWLENVPQTLRQPDGTFLNCYATGDEYHNWLHDAAGYTIIQDPATGYFVYALSGNGELVPSSYVAGIVDPAAVGLSPGTNIAPERMLQKRQSALSKTGGLSVPEVTAAPKKGSINNLCIFIRFSDEPEYTDLQSKYATLFNDGTAGANSLRLYFNEASYGQLSILTYLYPAVAAGQPVISYQDPHPRAYYQPYSATTNPIGYRSSGSDECDREHALLKAAVNFVAPLVPDPSIFDADYDGRIDNVVFIVDGSPTGWSSLLWPHRWSLYSQTASIGSKRVYDYNLQLQKSVNTSVLCHEMAHSVGFPDLYHYVGDGKNPVATWDLMAANRNPPQHMGAYLKMRYGTWIASIPTITSSGTFTLQPLTSPTNNAYKIASPNSPTEYYIVEYRKRQGTFESSLQGEGLLIYRINGSLSGTGDSGGPPDEVYVYRPGGTIISDGTYATANFSSTVGRTMINDSTSPSAFLSDGSFGGLNISEIGAPGSTLSFKVTIGGGGNSIAFQTDPPGLKVIVDGATRTTPCAAIWPDWSAHTLGISTPQAGKSGTQYIFTSWSDGGPPSHQISALSGNATYTARFQTQHMLTMAPGSGGIVSPASGWQNSGDTVTILATPLVGCSFSGWTGSGTGSYTGMTSQARVSMNGPLTQVANFKASGTDVEEVVAGIPQTTRVEQNYPNPFNPVTTIKYNISGARGQGPGAGEAGTRGSGPGTRNTRLIVYDLLGREVAVLVDEPKAPGQYEVQFDASKMASGMYLYRLTVGNVVQTRAMVFLK